MSVQPIVAKEGEVHHTRKIRYWLTFLAFCAAAAVLAVIQGCSPFTGWIANKVYPDLVEPQETEAPSTFSVYLPSSATEAVLGGSGRGLNCSIPPLAGPAFEREKDHAPVSLRFRQACVMHDFCYRHGYATYGYSQADCDTMLQESAYRLCRQINDPNKSKVSESSQASDDAFADCETQAKKVLLGVVLGGAGSYQPAGRSTYFEYDPMPARADNYVVGRAVPQSMNAPTVEDLGIRTFFIKRNMVEVKALVTSRSEATTLKGQGTAPVPFPERRIATPPVLLDVKGFPSLVSLARDSFGDTSLKAFSFDDMQNGPRDCWDGDAGRCKSASDTSVHKLANVDGKAILVSLDHRGSLANGEKGIAVTIVQRNLGGQLKMLDYALNGTLPMYNTYRFLSHDLLLEKDWLGQATHVWTLARGVGIDRSGSHYMNDKTGSDYQMRLVVARQALGNDGTGKTVRFSLDAKETDEPLSLVRLGHEAGTALIGLSWDEVDLTRVENGKTPENPPQLKVWRMPLSGAAPHPKPEVLPLLVSAEEGFVDMAPIVARVSGKDAALLILAKVSDGLEASKTGKGQFGVPEPVTGLTVRFQIDGLESHSGSALQMRPWIRLSCALDLSEQLNAATNIRQRAYRSIGENPDTYESDRSHNVYRFFRLSCG